MSRKGMVTLVVLVPALIGLKHIAMSKCIHHREQKEVSDVA